MIWDLAGVDLFALGFYRTKTGKLYWRCDACGGRTAVNETNGRIQRHSPREAGMTGWCPRGGETVEL